MAIGISHGTDMPILTLSRRLWAGRSMCGLSPVLAGHVNTIHYLDRTAISSEMEQFDLLFRTLYASSERATPYLDSLVMFHHRKLRETSR